jgi:hypothetical protein
MYNFKIAFDMIFPNSTPNQWGKMIWSVIIPPSKSFLIWRYHNKMPTHDQLWKRCCVYVHCHCVSENDYKTMPHLFFQSGLAKDLSDLGLGNI